MVQPHLYLYSGMLTNQHPAALQLADSILQPERLKACEESLEPGAIRRMWPREVAEKTFIDYLWSQYDYTQLGAIEVSLVRHTGIRLQGDNACPDICCRELCIPHTCMFNLL